MIEKIMKAVKSSNKRRGRNITIGTVIVFLLSCTAVMGVTEGNYLWIKDNNGINLVLIIVNLIHKKIHMKMLEILGAKMFIQIT